MNKQYTRMKVIVAEKLSNDRGESNADKHTSRHRTEKDNKTPSYQIILTAPAPSFLHPACLPAYSRKGKKRVCCQTEGSDRLRHPSHKRTPTLIMSMKKNS